MRYVGSICLIFIVLLASCQNTVEEAESSKATPHIEMNEETKEKLFALPKPDDVTYSGTEFRKGMNRTEVLELYGAPDSRFTTANKTYEIYGNIGLYYKNKEISDVIYYANTDKKSIINLIGQPDREVENNGLYEISYLLKYVDHEETHLVLWSTDNEQIGPVTLEVISKEDKKETVNKEHNHKPKPKNKDEALARFMETYVEELVAYYNGASDEVMKFIEANSKAAAKVEENKDSGDFKDQKSLSVHLIKYTYFNEDYDATIAREYKDNHSKSKKTSIMNYKLEKTGDTFKVIDFSEQ